jgi:hypothetical protein
MTAEILWVESTRRSGPRSRYLECLPIGAYKAMKELIAGRLRKDDLPVSKAMVKLIYDGLAGRCVIETEIVKDGVKTVQRITVSPAIFLKVDIHAEIPRARPQDPGCQEKEPRDRWQHKDRVALGAERSPAAPRAATERTQSPRSESRQATPRNDLGPRRRARCRPARSRLRPSPRTPMMPSIQPSWSKTGFEQGGC